MLHSWIASNGTYTFRIPVLTHPTDVFVASSLAALRIDSRSTALQSNERLADNIYFSRDQEGGDVTVDMSTKPGRLMDVSVRIAKSPRWFTFNIGLGKATYAEGDVLGLVLELSGNGLEVLPLFVRTARNNKTSDTTLDDRIPVASSVEICTVLHSMTAEDAMVGAAGFRTLVMPLPDRDFDLALIDARFFVIPAACRVRG